MKTKRIVLCALAVLLAFGLGFTGVLSFAAEDSETEAEGSDMLVGVFITQEYLDLFDFDSFFNDNANRIVSGGEITAEDSAAYTGRIYAEEVPRPLTDPETGEVADYTVDYVFPELEGWLIGCLEVVQEDGSSYFRSVADDEAISSSNFVMKSTDDGDETSIEGTLYVDPMAVNTQFFFNPVYQDTQGRLYVTSGQGMQFSGDQGEGMAFAHIYSDSVTTTVDGVSSTKSNSVQVTVETMYPPEQIVLLSYNAAGERLDRQEYDPNAMPEELTLAEGTAYLVAESYKTSPEGETVVTREIYGETDDTLETFRCREDGVLVKNYTALNWGE